MYSHEQQPCLLARHAEWQHYLMLSGDHILISAPSHVLHKRNLQAKKTS